MDSFEGISRDPISLHKYLYANADPVKFADPSGRITRLTAAVLTIAIAYQVVKWIFTQAGKRIAKRTGEIGATQLELEEIAIAIDLYEIDNGDYPTTQQGLYSLLHPPYSPPYAPRWKEGGYLNIRRNLTSAGLPADPWGSAFMYKYGSGDKMFVIYSIGPDRSDGTADDIYRKVRQ